MKRWIPVLLLCAVPVGAQTWGHDPYVIGNTLVPGVLLADGKSRGHGPSRGPAPSPAPSTTQSFSEGRGESGFSAQPFRVQLEGPPPQPAQLPSYAVEVPPITGVTPLTPTGPVPHATLTIPVQLLYRPSEVRLERRLSPEQLPVYPTCPACPAMPEVTPLPAPAPMMAPAPSRAYRLCNVSGQCIPWP